MIAARKMQQALVFGLFRLAALIVIASLGGIVFYILANGLSAISWKFLTGMADEGGIFPALIGTLYLTIGAVLVALPLGVATAVYLSEYAKEGRILLIVRLGVQNLAGVPSVVFGLFGLAFFCIFFGMGFSLLAGCLTLGILILPTVVGAAEEALRQVPATFREASLALGASRWQTIYKVVLPAALPGIITGSILGVGRAAGETAPIMFTAAAALSTHLPSSIFNQVMALPYHIYKLATASMDMDKARPAQFGTALVLIALVLGLCLFAIIIRARMRRKKKW
ncbi:MAG: phosphate ABC transporter permease PstA [Thermodesulfobacteriota bacterium]